jgi:hypothetical protein
VVETIATTASRTVPGLTQERSPGISITAESRGKRLTASTVITLPNPKGRGVLRKSGTRASRKVAGVCAVAGVTRAPHRACSMVENPAMIVLEVPAFLVMQICPSRKQTHAERTHQRDAKPHGQLLLQRPPVSRKFENCHHRTITYQERTIEVPRSEGGTRASDSQ